MSIEFLVVYFGKDKSVIEECIDQTAKITKIPRDEVMDIVSDRAGKRLGTLPIEVVVLIIEHLPVQDLLKLCETSRAFDRYCKDNRIWKILLKRDFGAKGGDNAKEQYILYSQMLQISCGSGFTGFVRSGKVYMWGRNDKGQSGFRKRENHLVPTHLPIKEKVVQISCEYLISGAITENGKLYMWGENTNGTLIHSKQNKIFTPFIVPVTGKVIQVSCGKDHVGVVTENGKLYMWGDNNSGQIGNGYAGGTQLTPTLVRFKEKVSQVSCGFATTGVVTKSGKLYMWGDNQFGALAIGSLGGLMTMPDHVAIDGKVVQVSSGVSHSGAVTRDGKLYMWGDNQRGQLGDGTAIGKSIPTLISSINGVVQVSCGDYHTGAVTKEGKLYMWGSNMFGKLGVRKGIVASVIPMHVPIPGGVEQVSCGLHNTGVVSKDKKVYMWGSGFHGQIGNGAVTNSSTPVFIDV